MAYETILFDLSDGIARITLNRPDRLNSFTRAMHGELREALADLGDAHGHQHQGPEFEDGVGLDEADVVEGETRTERTEIAGLDDERRPVDARRRSHQPPAEGKGQTKEGVANP